MTRGSEGIAVIELGYVGRPLALARGADLKEIGSPYGRSPVELLAPDGVVADIKALWRGQRDDFHRRYWSL